MKTQRQKALDWYNELGKLERDMLSLDYYGSTVIFDDEIEAMYLHYIPQEKLYTEKELREVCHKVLNMGMILRQNQLAGYDGKSGNELLEEYFKENLWKI